MNAISAFQRPSCEKYRPHHSWFLNDRRGIHGEGHGARVLVWANAIASEMQAQGTVVDIEVVRWAAVLHDVRRCNDGHDPEHGLRCAHWIHSQALALAGMDERRRALLAFCCQWHVPPDEAAPERTAELVCLKDADALDRVRVESLNVRYLRTAVARGFVQHAQMLCSLSEAYSLRAACHWSAVREAAIAMGLWPTEHANADRSWARLRFLRCS